MYQGVVLNPDSLVEEEVRENTETEQQDASITVRVSFNWLFIDFVYWCLNVITKLLQFDLRSEMKKEDNAQTENVIFNEVHI